MLHRTTMKHLLSILVFPTSLKNPTINQTCLTFPNLSSQGIIFKLLENLVPPTQIGFVGLLSSVYLLTLCSVPELHVTEGLWIVDEG